MTLSRWMERVRRDWNAIDARDANYVNLTLAVSDRLEATDTVTHIETGLVYRLGQARLGYATL